METNMGGGYGFFDLVAGNYTVEASLTGYVSQRGTIKVRGLTKSPSGSIRAPVSVE